MVRLTPAAPGTDDVIKVEIWDVVDKGILLEEGGDAAPPQQYQVADAEALDVYQHANGVILLFNPTKPKTVEYAAQLLPKVPAHLPVLVLATFADRLFAQEDESFLRRRFTALHRGSADEQGGLAPGSLHFMLGSLTEPACPLNPARGLLPAVVKFFELPFLHLQRQTLLAKLKSNSGQMEQARQEWEAFIGGDGVGGGESGGKGALGERGGGRLFLGGAARRPHQHHRPDRLHSQQSVHGHANCRLQAGLE